MRLEESAALRFPVVSAFSACVTTKMLGLFVFRKSLKIMVMVTFLLSLIITIACLLFVTVIAVVYINRSVSHTYKIGLRGFARGYLDRKERRRKELSILSRQNMDPVRYGLITMALSLASMILNFASCFLTGTLALVLLLTGLLLLAIAVVRLVTLLNIARKDSSKTPMRLKELLSLLSTL